MAKKNKKTIKVGLIQKNGPTTLVDVEIDLDKFITCSDPDSYIREKATLGFMGSSFFNISYNYTKQDARRDLKEL